MFVLSFIFNLTSKHRGFRRFPLLNKKEDLDSFCSLSCINKTRVELCKSTKCKVPLSCFLQRHIISIHLKWSGKKCICIQTVGWNMGWKCVLNLASARLPCTGHLHFDWQWLWIYLHFVFFINIIWLNCKRVAAGAQRGLCTAQSLNHKFQLMMQPLNSHQK